MKYLTTGGVSYKTGLRESTVRWLANQGRLPALIIDRGAGIPMRLFSEADVDNFIAERTARKLARVVRTSEAQDGV